MPGVLSGVSFVCTSDTSATGWGSPAALLEALSVVQSLGGVLCTVKHPSRESLHYNILAAPGEGATAAAFKERADLCNRPIFMYNWILELRSRQYLSFRAGEDVAVPDDFSHPVLFGDIAARDAYAQQKVEEVLSSARGQTATSAAFPAAPFARRGIRRLDGAGNSLASVPALYDTQGSQLASPGRADDEVVAGLDLPGEVPAAAGQSSDVHVGPRMAAPRGRYLTDAQPQQDESQSPFHSQDGLATGPGIGQGVVSRVGRTEEARSPSSYVNRGQTGVSPADNHVRSPAGQFVWGGQESQVLFFQRSPAPPTAAVPALCVEQPPGTADNGEQVAERAIGADRASAAQDSADAPGTTLDTGNGESGDVSGGASSKGSSPAANGNAAAPSHNVHSGPRSTVSTEHTGIGGLMTGMPMPKASDLVEVPDISLGSAKDITASKNTPGSKGSTSTTTTTSTPAALAALAGLPTSHSQEQGHDVVVQGVALSTGMAGVSQSQGYDVSGGQGAQDNTSWSGPTPWQPYPPPSAGLSAYNPSAYGYGAPVVPPPSALQPSSVSRFGPFLTALQNGASAMKTPAMSGLRHGSEGSLPLPSSDPEKGVGLASRPSHGGTGETTSRKRVRIDAPPGNGDSPAAHRAYQSHTKLQQPCLNGNNSSEEAASSSEELFDEQQRHLQQQPGQKTVPSSASAAPQPSSPLPEPRHADIDLEDDQEGVGMTDTQDSFWVGFGEGVDSQGASQGQQEQTEAVVDSGNDMDADAVEKQQDVVKTAAATDSAIVGPDGAPDGLKSDSVEGEQDSMGSTNGIQRPLASPADASAAAAALISPIVYAAEATRLVTGAGTVLDSKPGNSAPERRVNLQAEHAAGTVLSGGSTGSQQLLSQVPSQPPGLFIASQQQAPFGGQNLGALVQNGASASGSVPGRQVQPSVPVQAFAHGAGLRSPSTSTPANLLQPPAGAARLSQESGNTGGSPPFSREASPDSGSDRRELDDADKDADGEKLSGEKSSSAPSTQSAHGSGAAPLSSFVQGAQVQEVPGTTGLQGGQDHASLSESSTVPDGQGGEGVGLLRTESASDREEAMDEAPQGTLAVAHGQEPGVAVAGVPAAEQGEREGSSVASPGSGGPSSQVQGSSPVDSRLHAVEGEASAVAAMAPKPIPVMQAVDGQVADGAFAGAEGQAASDGTEARPAKRRRFAGVYNQH